MKKLAKQMNYEPPVLEIIEVEIEAGFATSGGDFENPIEDTPGSW